MTPSDWQQAQKLVQNGADVGHMGLAVDTLAFETTARATSNKRQILLSTDELQINDETIEALSKRQGLYQRGPALVEIRRDVTRLPGISRPAQTPSICDIELPRLRELIADSVEFQQEVGDSGVRSVHPPDWNVKGVHARKFWPNIAPITAVAESPILRTNGTILDTPGYDDSTGIVYEPSIEFPSIPDRPSVDDAIRARDELLEVVGDFPFEKPAHKSAWLASALTPFARFAFDGPSPMSAVDANVRGAGKSLLVDTIAILATGREAARMTVPRDDDEFRKRITSIALAGERLVLLDNVAGALGSPSLDAALTSTYWNDRKLGKSEVTGALPLYVNWYCTGNNLVLQADTARRCLHIRLESLEERPEERDGFRHPRLLTWVRQERPRLVVSALTILRAYFVAGRPDPHVKPWGSFESWSSLIRGAVIWVGMPDPGDTRQELAERSDLEAAALNGLLDGIQEMAIEGVTVANILKRLEAEPDDHELLRNAVQEICKAPAGRLPDSRSLGNRLRHLQRRVAGGRYLHSRPGRGGVVVWAVREAKLPKEPDLDGGSGGSGGSAPPPSCAPACTRAPAHAHANEGDVANQSNQTHRTEGNEVPF